MLAHPSIQSSAQVGSGLADVGGHEDEDGEEVEEEGEPVHHLGQQVPARDQLGAAPAQRQAARLRVLGTVLQF